MEQTKKVESLKRMAAEAIFKINGYRCYILLYEDIPQELNKYLRVERMKKTDALIEKHKRFLY